jgi:hypothetical protein
VHGQAGQSRGEDDGDDADLEAEQRDRRSDRVEGAVRSFGTERSRRSSWLRCRRTQPTPSGKRKSPGWVPTSCRSVSPATTHVFIFSKTRDGGTQRVVAKRASDTAQVRLVREHLRLIGPSF